MANYISGLTAEKRCGGSRESAAASPSGRMLILMSDTGGGHRASAEAIRQEIAARAGDAVQVDIIDLLSDWLPRPVSVLPGTYPFLVRRVPHLWGALWHFFEREHPAHTLERAAVAVFSSSIEAHIDLYAPDLIVSVHPLVQHLTLAALERSDRAIPFITVVTDLVKPHRGWFHPGVTRCYVPGPTALQRASALGLSREQLHVSGLPVRSSFLRVPPGQVDLRRRLGLDPDRPVVLLLGGGVDGRHMEQIVRLLDGAITVQGEDIQSVVICGHNRPLYRRLASGRRPQSLRVLKQVANMAEWMQAADCVVTKAGPGTIAEALVCGRPLILIGAIPGQEEGNIDYVVKHGAGCFCPRPKKVAAQVQAWLGPDRTGYARTARCATKLATPRATAEIVEGLLELL